MPGVQRSQTIVNRTRYRRPGTISPQEGIISLLEVQESTIYAVVLLHNCIFKPLLSCTVH